jgi:hypothetical protein
LIEPLKFSLPLDIVTVQIELTPDTGDRNHDKKEAFYLKKRSAFLPVI